MALTGFRIVITAGMGRFLRVYPQPNGPTATTPEEKAKILGALRRLWPEQARIEWTPDEQGILRSYSKPVGGQASKFCAQMLYVGLNGQRESITDDQATAMVATELRKAFPGVQV